MKAKSILAGISAVLLIAGVAALSGCNSSDTQTSTTSKTETVSKNSSDIEYIAIMSDIELE